MARVVSRARPAPLLHALRCQPRARPRRSYPHLLSVALARLLYDAREHLLAAGPRLDHLALALGAVALGERGLDAQLGAQRQRPQCQPLDRLARRVLLRARQVDEPAVEPEADRAPHVLLDQPWLRMGERHAFVDIAGRLGNARDHQPGERLRLLRGGLRVADSYLHGAEAEMRPDRPPHLREL